MKGQNLNKISLSLSPQMLITDQTETHCPPVFPFIQLQLSVPQALINHLIAAGDLVSSSEGDNNQGDLLLFVRSSNLDPFSQGTTQSGYILLSSSRRSSSAEFMGLSSPEACKGPDHSGIFHCDRCFDDFIEVGIRESCKDKHQFRFHLFDRKSVGRASTLSLK